MTTFRQWLKENYNGANCPEGDLYEDMKREDEMRRKYPEKFPQYALWKNDRDWILDHLHSLNADKEVIKTFRRAWKEYLRDVEMGFA